MAFFHTGLKFHLYSCWMLYNVSDTGFLCSLWNSVQELYQASQINNQCKKLYLWPSFTSCGTGWCVCNGFLVLNLTVWKFLRDTPTCCESIQQSYSNRGLQVFAVFCFFKSSSRDIRLYVSAIFSCVRLYTRKSRWLPYHRPHLLKRGLQRRPEAVSELDGCKYGAYSL